MLYLLHCATAVPKEEMKALEKRNRCCRSVHDLIYIFLLAIHRCAAAPSSWPLPPLCLLVTNAFILVCDAATAVHVAAVAVVVKEQGRATSEDCLVSGWVSSVKATPSSGVEKFVGSKVQCLLCLELAL